MCVPAKLYAWRIYCFLLTLFVIPVHTGLDGFRRGLSPDLRKNYKGLFARTIGKHNRLVAEKEALGKDDIVVKVAHVMSEHSMAFQIVHSAEAPQVKAILLVPGLFANVSQRARPSKGQIHTRFRLD